MQKKLSNGLDASLRSSMSDTSILGNANSLNGWCPNSRSFGSGDRGKNLRNYGRINMGRFKRLFYLSRRLPSPSPELPLYRQLDRLNSRFWPLYYRETSVGRSNRRFKRICPSGRVIMPSLSKTSLIRAIRPIKRTILCYGGYI
jgi:hypothetical protein